MSDRFKLHLQILEDGSLFIDYEGGVDVLVAALTLASERSEVLANGVVESARWIEQNRTKTLVIN